MPQYLTERNYAEQLVVTKDGIEGVKRVNEEEGVVWIFSFLSADKKKTYCLYELMSVYQHMTNTAGIATVCYGAASRYLGMLAATLGEFDRAEAHFEHALDMNARMGARPWLAHTKAEYALLLRRRGGKGVSERAEMLANEACEIAAELDMVRLKKRLQPKVH